MKKIVFRVALLAAMPLAASQAAQSPERQVDALFAKWNRPGMPGAVVEVIRDGKVVLARGYGMADLEHNVLMTPSASFTVGSNSKQFTAFSIYLLAQDGKLSLDDDIRKVLPEVPDFGKTITIRHLLHHTSGLRDYFDLMFMTGTRVDDVITPEDALALVKRQRALNFAPGQHYVYSNTGYLLLGQIVQRASGMPLAEFARVRIFEPLGMKHTRFLHGYGTIVPQRALPYLPSGAGGYDYVAVGDSADGAGGLVATAGDLALWDQNFYDGRVGGLALLARMQEPGVLGDGKPFNYASGLVVDAYRGRRIVEHGGAISGFNAQMTRFPDQHFSVLVLANTSTSDLDAGRMTRRIADIYLDHETPAQPAVPVAQEKVFKEIAFDPARLDALVGYYALSPQSGIEFSKEDGQLWARATGQARIPALPYGERDFFAKAIAAQFSFDAPGADGIAAGGVLHQNGRDIPARRTTRPGPPAELLTKFEGDFYSDELHVVYTVASKDGALVLTYPRGTVALDVDDKDALSLGSPFGTIKYQCGAQDGCTGFTVSNGRVWNLRFNRVALAAPATRAAH